MAAKRLLQLMDELVHAQRDLLAQAERKRRLLIESHVDELPECYRSELQVLERITKLQAEWRSAAHDMLGRQDQSAGDSLDFRSVIDMIDGDEVRNELLSYEKQFIDLHAELKRRNEQNQRLAEQQLEYIDQMVALYQDPVDQEFTYGNPAGSRQAAPGNTMKRFESRA